MGFVLYADKNRLTVRQREPVTSGSVSAYIAKFEFSGDWDELTRTVVFKAGSESRSILLDGEECTIPWEVLTSHGRQLTVGVYGTCSGDMVLPTVWASLGTILEGVTTGEAAQPPTPDLWEQELAGKGDKLDYTPDGDLGLYAGDKLLSAVPVVGGTGDGGWGIGHGLKIVGGNLTVNSVSDFDGDNTLPITAAGVLITVGNIEALLGTI